MQRIGFLYFVCKNASKSKTTTRELLGSKLRTELSRDVREGDTDLPFPIDWNLVRRKIETYRTSGSRNRYKGKPRDVAEYQDYLLTDPRLPSSTGPVTDEVAVDLVDEAVAWGLVRPINYTLTDRGMALVHVWSSSDLDNPLLLGRLGRHTCSYWYLDADGDALRCIYGSMESRHFTREDLGVAVRTGIDQLLGDVKAIARIDRGTRTRLRALAKAMKESRGNASGTGRASYQQGTMRGEHPADLGLLRKAEPSSYVYDLLDESFLGAIPDDIDRFLDRDFARTYSRLVCGSTNPMSQADPVPYFVEAYKILRDRMGYASYRESLVLAQAFAAAADEWFEIARIKDEIEGPNARLHTRLGIGRSGKPEYVKVDVG